MQKQELVGITYDEARKRARVVLWDRGSDYAEPYATIEEGHSLAQVPLRRQLTAEDKEDIFHDALFAWIRKQPAHLARCQELGIDPITWFGGIVRNIAMRRLEAVEQSRSTPIPSQDPVFMQVSDADRARRWQLSTDTHQLLGDVLATTAQAIIDGYTQSEIAQAMGVSQPAIAKRVDRIRERMAAQQ